MAEKATTLNAAEVVLDLEDAVPNLPAEKDSARRLLVASLRELDFGHRTVSVRINGILGPHALRDVLALVPAVADRISCLVVPKVASPSQVSFVDQLLSSLEAEAGISTPLGLELQIEDPKGLEAVSEIANASSRTEALIFVRGTLRLPWGCPSLPSARRRPAIQATSGITHFSGSRWRRGRAASRPSMVRSQTLPTSRCSNAPPDVRSSSAMKASG